MPRAFIFYIIILLPSFLYSNTVLNYTLKKEDTLLELCDIFNVSQQELKKHNNTITVDRFWAGETLRIPLKGVHIKKYRVKKGDSLFLIIKRHRLNPELLYKINSQNVLKRMWAGDILKLPIPRTAKKIGPIKQKRVLPGKGFIYKIKKGDSFFSLSKKFGIRVDTLQSIYSKPTLYAGTSIRIPVKKNISSKPKDCLRPPFFKLLPEKNRLSVPGLHYYPKRSMGVKSPLEGKVIGIRKLKGFGKTIFIRKNNTIVLLASKGFQNILVSYGYRLKQEQIAATIRRNYYLHLFTIRNGVFVPPNDYLK